MSNLNEIRSPTSASSQRFSVLQNTKTPVTKRGQGYLNSKTGGKHSPWIPEAFPSVPVPYPPVASPGEVGAAHPRVAGLVPAGRLLPSAPVPRPVTRVAPRARTAPVTQQATVRTDHTCRGVMGDLSDLAWSWNPLGWGGRRLECRPPPLMNHSWWCPLSDPSNWRTTWTCTPPCGQPRGGVGTLSFSFSPNP